MRAKIFGNLGWIGIIIALSIPSLAHALSISIYTDRASWEAAVSGTILEESFEDTNLNAGLRVKTDKGHVDTSKGVWWDRMSTGYDWTTTFSFTPNISAFGGEWDLAGPGGPGQGILVTLPFSTAPTVLSIDRNTEGTFWGFVSDTPFASVTLQGWNQSGWAETFELDKLVYSGAKVPGGGSHGSGGAVPEPHSILLFGTGVAGFLGWRFWKRRTGTA